MRKASLKYLVVFFAMPIFTLHLNKIHAEEIIKIEPVYVASWDNYNPQNPYWAYEYAFGNSPQEACEKVLEQNIPLILGYTYSHYMDDWVGKRCAIRSPNNPDVYSRLWINYPIYLCPVNSSYSALADGCVCANGFYVEGNSCTPPSISLEGPSSTQALPSSSGAVTQSVIVSHNGTPKKSVSVNVNIQENGSSFGSISGTTNDEGVFNFKYIPPFFKSTSVDLTATCFSCSNTASKSISVVGVDAEEPQMCRP